MPIYEFACPKCRRIYSFLSKRVKPDHLPACPKCGNKKLSKQVSRFAMTRGLQETHLQKHPEDDQVRFDYSDTLAALGEVNAALRELDILVARNEHPSPDVVARLNAEMVQIVKSPDFGKRLAVASTTAPMEALRQSPRLDWLNSFFAGVDWMPLGELAARKIRLTNGSGLNANTVADLLKIALGAQSKA